MFIGYALNKLRNTNIVKQREEGGGGQRNNLIFSMLFTLIIAVNASSQLAVFTYHVEAQHIDAPVNKALHKYIILGKDTQPCYPITLSVLQLCN